LIGEPPTQGKRGDICNASAMHHLSQRITSGVNLRTVGYLKSISFSDGIPGLLTTAGRLTRLYRVRLIISKVAVKGTERRMSSPPPEALAIDPEATGEDPELVLAPEVDEKATGTQAKLSVSMRHCL
jgi:hypothetical protein